MSFVDRFENTMTSWQRLTRAAETTLLDNVAATVPWLASLLPAAIAYKHLVNYLRFDWWLALAGAAVVELLGVATIHTALQLWEFNATKNKSDQAAPFKLAVGAGAVYFVVVVVVNMVLEIGGAAVWDFPFWSRVGAKGLLSLLAPVGAFVLALRTQHARRLAKREQDKTERREARELGQLRKQVPALKQELAEMKQENVALQRVAADVKRLTAELETALSQRETAETEAERLRTADETLRHSLSQLETRWDALPMDVRAAVMRETDGGSFEQLAAEFGLSKSMVYRTHKRLFDAAEPGGFSTKWSAWSVSCRNPVIRCGAIIRGICGIGMWWSRDLWEVSDYSLRGSVFKRRYC